MDLTLKSEDGKTAMDPATEAGHEKAAILLGEGITKSFKKGEDKYRDRLNVTFLNLSVLFKQSTINSI